MANTSYQSQYSGLEVEKVFTDILDVEKIENLGKFITVDSTGKFVAQQVNVGVSGVKGDTETLYRTGNVNLTPANIGAATSAQGTKADTAVQTIQINGTTQTKTSGVVNLPAYPTSLPASNTTDSYSSTGTNPVSGKAVAAALGTLDGTISGTPGAGKTLTAFSETDGKVNATFENISVTKSLVSDLGTIGAAAAKDVVTSVDTSANLPTSGAVKTYVDTAIGDAIDGSY